MDVMTIKGNQMEQQHMKEFIQDLLLPTWDQAHSPWRTNKEVPETQYTGVPQFARSLSTVGTVVILLFFTQEQSELL